MIAVAGGKGGSGKTTTTVGLARALSRRGAAVVAADADCELPNLTALAATTAAPLATAVGGQTAGGRTAGGQTAGGQTAGNRTESPRQQPTRLTDITDTDTQLAVTRATPTFLDAAPPADGAVSTRPFERLRAVTPASSPVLLDCPAGASTDAAVPLRAADQSVLVTPLDQEALCDTAKTAAIARRLDCPPVGAVITRASSTPPSVADLLCCPVLGTIPARSPKPLASDAVRAAYDAVARKLARCSRGDRWRIT